MERKATRTLGCRCWDQDQVSVWVTRNNGGGALGSRTATLSWRRCHEGQSTVPILLLIKLVGVSPSLVHAGVVAIEAGFSFSFVLKQDGSVLATGDNYYTQLGLVWPVPKQVNTYHEIFPAKSGELVSRAHLRPTPTQRRTCICVCMYSHAHPDLHSCVTHLNACSCTHLHCTKTHADANISLRSLHSYFHLLARHKRIPCTPCSSPSATSACTRTHTLTRIVTHLHIAVFHAAVKPPTPLHALPIRPLTPTTPCARLHDYHQPPTFLCRSRTQAL